MYQDMWLQERAAVGMRQVLVLWGEKQQKIAVCLIYFIFSPGKVVSPCRS